MGVVQRQGISAGIFLYMGMVIGFINTTLLMPRIIGEEVFGFTQWLAFATLLLSTLSILGLNTTTVRFFPYFRQPESKHSGFFFFLILLATGFSGIAAIMVLFFRSSVVSIFSDQRSEAFLEAYYWLLPLMMVLFTFFTLLQSYTQALLRPRTGVFVEQFVLRVLTLLLTIAVALQWISLSDFIVLYVLRLALGIAALLFFLWRIGELHWQPNFTIFRSTRIKEMAQFSGFSTFSQLGNQLTFRIDILMLGPLLGFDRTGIYAVFLYVSTAIIMPYRGLATIVTPLFANAWKDNDIAKIQDLYARSAHINLVVSVLLFIGIAANLHNLIAIIGNEYRVGTMVAIYLGIAQVFNAMNGYVGQVIMHSRLYRFDLVSKIIAVVTTVITNYFFIRQFGLTGAAIATLITIVLINTINQVFVYTRFGLHPFSNKTWIPLLLGLVVLTLQTLLPLEGYHFLIDLVARSACITVLYMTGVFYFRVAPDINDFLWRQWQRLRP